MKKAIKFLVFIVATSIVCFILYAYKLHTLAVKGNDIFEKRCTQVNPPLISYKNAFLKYADYLNDPTEEKLENIGDYLNDYVSGMRQYVSEEDKWLVEQKEYLDRWDFQLLEPWYMKQASEYQLKMYEGYRDEAKYMLETFDAGGMTEEIGSKFSEARTRRQKYEGLYFEFFDQAQQIRDWRKTLGNVPILEGCTAENMDIPDTSGSIDWDGTETPTPTPQLNDSDVVS